MQSDFLMEVFLKEIFIKVVMFLFSIFIIVLLNPQLYRYGARDKGFARNLLFLTTGSGLACRGTCPCESCKMLPEVDWHAEGRVHVSPARCCWKHRPNADLLQTRGQLVFILKEILWIISLKLL